MSSFRRKNNSEDLDKKLVFSLSDSKPSLPRSYQFRQLPKMLKSSERWILRIAFAVLFAALSVGLTRFFQAHLEWVPLDGGNYREAVVGTPQFINPILASSDVDKDLSRLIFASLLKYNERGELIGDLAQEFYLEENGTAARFVLRDGIKWHDGEPLDAEDVLFTLEAVKNPQWQSPLWYTFQGITVESPDPKTVIVRSDAFTPNFPHLFTLGIIPKHIWQNVDPQSARLANWNIKPVGSGPFKFKSLAKNRDGVLSYYRLTRNADYHEDTAHIKEITLWLFPDFESALAALRAHTVDGVSFIPDRLRAKIPSSGVNVFKFTFPRFITLFFQDRKAEALRNKAVRRALSAAIDRETLINLIPDAKIAYAPFLEDQIGYALTVERPRFGLERAKELLKEGGWKQNEEGRWVPESGGSKEYLSLTLTALDEQASLLTAAAIKRFWEELGVEVKLEAASRLRFGRDVLQPRAFEVALFTLIAGADPDPYPFWHSSQIDDPGLNLGSVKSRAIDIALEQGRSTADETQRLNSYIEFQNLLQEEAPGIVLYSSPYVYAVSKRVRGIGTKMIATPADRFNDIEAWFMRSRLGWE